jgi:hypothetical protein
MSPCAGLDVLEKVKSLCPGREQNDFSVVPYRLSGNMDDDEEGRTNFVNF